MALDVYKDWLGIPEGQRPPDHYTLLRLVQFEDDPEKIRGNYKKLNAHVRKYATGQYSAESQDLLNELAKSMLCLTDPERKRDYDESMGREFKEQPGMLGQRALEKILAEKGHISRDQIQELRDFADARGLSIRDAAVQMKLVNAETATQALAEELSRPYVDLAEMLPDDSVLDQVPRSLVKRHTILPLFVDDDMVLVACADDPEPELQDEIRLRYEYPMRVVLSTPLAINQAIAQYYAPGMRDEAAVTDKPAKSGSSKTKPAKKEKQKKNASDKSTEAAERKNIGIISMMMSFVVCAMLDNFVMPYSLTHWGPSFLPFFLTLIIPPIVICYVVFVYWKQK